MNYLMSEINQAHREQVQARREAYIDQRMESALQRLTMVEVNELDQDVLGALGAVAELTAPAPIEMPASDPTRALWLLGWVAVLTIVFMIIL